MQSRPLTLVLSTILLLLAGAGLWLTTAHSEARAVAAPAGERAGAPAELAAAEEDQPLADKPLTAIQSELLDLAFQTASALPAYPHIKDRSRTQESVVAACLELDQPSRALDFSAKIDNWRRGEGLANVAFYCARHGDTAQARRCLEQALQVADAMKPDDDPSDQDEPRLEADQSWRKDRIKVGVARTLALLGDDEQAAALEAGVVVSEAGKVDGVRAMRLDAAVFDERLAALASLISSGDVEQAQTAMETCAQLYDRFYDDRERRERAKRTIQDAGAKLPGLTRIEVMMELGGFALDHGDAQTALDVVNETKLIAGACTHVPLVARLASLRYRAGDAQKARAEADLALALFEQQRADIVNIERADSLRPLAEAYQAMGDKTDALKVYKRALEEGVENPNSRPRAEDLSATCLSMARYGVEPDADLKARLYEIYGRLGSPW